MPADHLDDDVLSAAIDGVEPGASAAEHLDSCQPCRARLARFTDASRLVAAPVVPLEPSAVDAMVDRAMAAPVIPIGELRERRRLRRTMPPPWLVAVAAAIALVVGIPALLRSTGQDNLAATSERTSDLTTAGEATGGSASFGVGAGATADATTGDYLGVLDSDDAVVTSLRARLDIVQSEPQLLARPTTGAAEARAAGSAATKSPAAPAASAEAEAADSAFRDNAGPPVPTCKAEAKAAANTTSGGSEPIYLAPATWQGEAAMVFVFTVAQPADDGFRRQAYVMAVPGCAVVASPRF